MAQTGRRTAFEMARAQKKAAATDNISFIKKGTETASIDCMKPIPEIAEYCTTPHRWHISSPITPKSTGIINPCFFSIRCTPRPQKKDRKINPQRNPPVRPAVNICIPPLKPENTGIPRAPSARKTQTETVPYFIPRK